MKNDLFAHKAGSYESDKNRVNNVENIARTIIEKINFNPNMHIMDFGSGTGLLLEKIAPLVEKVTAVDISQSMNQQLENKRGSLPCELDILELNLAKTALAEKFDGIISSMTLHHVEDVNALLIKLRDNLQDGGFVAIADLETEDGSFHTEGAGVYHFGFNRAELEQQARDAGFTEVATHAASIVVKPHAQYNVFLLVGFKPSLDSN